MPSHNSERMSRIKSVEREFLATRFAVEFFFQSIQQDPSLLKNELRARDMRESQERLEETYLIRLFAEFETILRLFWNTQRDTYPPVRDLINGLSVQRRIPADRTTDAHLVREYRNKLVHERANPLEPIPIGIARSRLCYFLSFLPPNW